MNRCYRVAPGDVNQRLTVYSPCFFPYHFIHFLNSLSMDYREQTPSMTPFKPADPNPYAYSQLCSLLFQSAYADNRYEHQRLINLIPSTL